MYFFDRIRAFQGFSRSYSRNYFRDLHHMFRFSSNILLCMLIFYANLVSAADDVQDANKLFKKAQYAQALEKVDNFLVNKPKDAQARFLKGLILTEQGKTDNAIKEFSTLIDDYPELPEPYNNLAVLYAAQGQYDKAKSALEMAIHSHANYATAHENLGDIYAKMASQSYTRALQLDRKNVTAQAKLNKIDDLFGTNSQPSRPAPTTVSAAAIPVPINVTSTANTGEEVIKTLNDWAAAWTSGDAKKYLTFYAKEFKTPDGADREIWEVKRRDFIRKQKNITVEVVDAKASKADDTHAKVTFKQHYRTTTGNTVANKIMDMVKIDGNWLIASERSNQ
jgi:tetratricopeptide (TPR) repeat protein